MKLSITKSIVLYEQQNKKCFYCPAVFNGTIEATIVKRLLTISYLLPEEEKIQLIIYVLPVKDAIV